MNKTTTASNTRVATILFVDLVASSESASVLDIKMYNEHVKAFQKFVKVLFYNIFNEEVTTLYGKRFCDYSVRGDEGFLIVASKPGQDRGKNKDIIDVLSTALLLQYGWYHTINYMECLKQHRRPPEIAIGINTGSVCFNRDKSNGENSRKYKAEGYAINLAKRIESDSRKGEYSSIFVGESTYGYYHDIKGENTLRFKRLPRSSMKGITGHVRTYEIVFANLEEKEEDELLDLSKLEQSSLGIEKSESLKNEFFRTRNPWLGNVVCNLLWNRAWKLSEENNTKNDQEIAKMMVEAIDLARILVETEPDEALWKIYLVQIVFELLQKKIKKGVGIPSLDYKDYALQLIDDSNDLLKSVIVKHPYEIDARLYQGMFILEFLDTKYTDKQTEEKKKEIKDAIGILHQILLWEEEYPDAHYYLAAAHWALRNLLEGSAQERAEEKAVELFDKGLDVANMILANSAKDMLKEAREGTLFNDFPFESIGGINAENN